MQTKEIPKGEPKKIGIGTKRTKSVYGVAQKSLGLFYFWYVLMVCIKFLLIIWREIFATDYGEMEEKQRRGGDFFYIDVCRAFRACCYNSNWGPYTFSVHKYFRGLFPGGIPHVD